ncbi:nucleoside triphosphate pyrophosphohydrolase [Lysinibacillus fusiformis]|uniref:nucleoside triphosphate pyrophosphohydrolase n=1 Tax=Lysinibacillus fusiformis TaxID=28031 RepID=UPI001880038C|nr:nucleoside triphosphate pyrophosphohydrolase [Lysinibacillus fusiformis]MBD8521950.1 nucleoside triphosphate pyrophosphohydrolase [Lysinibacillus fusiformis]
MPIYNKLVRDHILEIMDAKGVTYHACTLEPIELLTEVKAKMLEEAREFHEATTVQDEVEELVDILELVHTAINALGVSYDELEVFRSQKKKERGGFDKGIYLINVEEQ